VGGKERKDVGGISAKSGMCIFSSHGISNFSLSSSGESLASPLHYYLELVFGSCTRLRLFVCRHGCDFSSAFPCVT
jgi:hypothetical protein